MDDNYHYDAKGNYTGKTSDKSPYVGGEPASNAECAAFLVIVFIVIIFCNIFK